MPLAPRDPNDRGVAEAAERVRRARSSRSADEARAWYASWAADYDRDVFATLGFTGSSRIAELLVAAVTDHDGPAALEVLTVLDLGCGTGAVGERLRDLGVGAVDGIDLSAEMLAVATSKGCYRWLGIADLTDASTLPTGTWAATVSAGTFTSGHVDARAVDGLVAVHAPSGWCAWVVALALWPDVSRAVARHGFTTIHAEPEPVRLGGAAESVMFVGRRRR
jgi:predicted TPR repeat methyltransferase